MPLGLALFPYFFWLFCFLMCRIRSYVAILCNAPPFMVFRALSQLSKKSHVLLSRLGLGRNPKVWNEPHKFKLERCLNFNLEYNKIKGVLHWHPLRFTVITLGIPLFTPDRNHPWYKWKLKLLNHWAFCPNSPFLLPSNVCWYEFWVLILF